MNTVIFYDFPGLENSLLKFHDFPRPRCMGTLLFWCFKSPRMSILHRCAKIWQKRRVSCSIYVIYFIFCFVVLCIVCRINIFSRLSVIAPCFVTCPSYTALIHACTQFWSALLVNLLHIFIFLIAYSVPLYIATVFWCYLCMFIRVYICYDTALST